MAKKILNNDTIESYHFKTLLPELASLGWRTFTQGTPGGPRPSDIQTFEICFIDKGSAEWWINDKLYEAGPKSLFINRPGEWHGGESGLVQPCEMYWLQFYLPPKGNLPGVGKQTQLELGDAFEHMQHRSFAASTGIKTFFDQLMNEQRHPRPYSLEMSRAAFHQLLITTVRDHTRKESFQYSEGIAQALLWINNHLEQDLYSEDLAQQSGMSVAQFYKRFTQEVGLTPNDHHLHQRIFAAKQALRNTSHSVTDIALQLGMSSSQYFATVFKKIVGITPTDYRRLRAKEKL